MDPTILPAPTVDGHDCANCHGQGNMACKGCLLVVYCNRACQVAHWKMHKKHCKSPMMKQDWQPNWVAQHRSPVFEFDAEKHKIYLSKKFFWGNMPALDVIQLKTNEGIDHKADLKFLFAASGDLRNVVKSMTELPAQFSRPTTWVVNDRDFEVVARNIIIVLIALTTPAVHAVPCMLHIWYSTLITQDHAYIVYGRVRDLIKESIQYTKPADARLGATWVFGSTSFRVELLRKEWDLLLAYLDPSKVEVLTAQQALQVREESGSDLVYKDCRDRHLFMLPPGHRLGNERFRKEGVLLPFAAERDGFDIPNPTFFQSAIWPLRPDADPIAGWSLPDILAHPTGAATSDLYGKFYYYIRKVLFAFHHRLHSKEMTILFVNMDATELRLLQHGHLFDRIEVSNISDRHYLGPSLTIIRLAPLLQTRNPHATLIMLFMNAINEIVATYPKELDVKAETRMVRKYMPEPFVPTSKLDPYFMKMTLSAIMFRDTEKWFDRWMHSFGFPEMIEHAKLHIHPGVAVKEPHTIVEKWPLRLKLEHGQPGAQEEFKILQVSDHTGVERYMEWKRNL